MLIRTSHGVIDILYSETDIFYVSVGLSGHSDLFEVRCSPPKNGSQGEVNVELGSYGQFGFSVGSFWPETMSSYNSIEDMTSLLDAPLYKALDELLQKIECSRKDGALSTFIYVLCSILVKGPLFITEGMEWYAATLQQTLFEVIGDFNQKTREPLFQRYAFLFDWTKSLDLEGAVDFPWDVPSRDELVPLPELFSFASFKKS